MPVGSVQHACQLARTVSYDVAREIEHQSCVDQDMYIVIRRQLYYAVYRWAVFRVAKYFLLRSYFVIVAQLLLLQDEALYLDEAL